MNRNFRILFSLSFLLGGLYACKKDNTPAPVAPPPVSGNYQLTYGDSIFYLNNQTSDYTILPTQSRVGEYTGFPDGIDINANTGEINVSKSETGLRYRISFYPAGSTDSFSTVIVISGINFLDGFYKLTTADSVIHPIYNANTNAVIPGLNTGSSFDDGSNCNSAGCTVNTANGIINLAQTVRNGVFGATPSNNDRHEFEMDYRISDNSGKSPNKIKIKLYYFNSIGDVTQEAYDIISEREGALFGIQPKTVPYENLTSVFGITQTTGKAAPPKPRPPCIFILGR
jgi:hypothetical protein